MDPHRDRPQTPPGRAANEPEGPRARPAQDAADDSVLAAALSACRSALERRLAGLREDGPRHTELESVRPQLTLFATTAAEKQLPPERAIVMLKRLIRALPVIVSWRETERENISHELVDMMITAYFGLGGRDATGVARGRNPLPDRG